MKFYGSVESMRSHPPPYSDPFILQWEIPQPRDKVERKYVVFDGISEYLKYHTEGRYTTCHEVFLSQGYNADDDVYGHPAFDIDMKLPKESEPASTAKELYERVGLPEHWMDMLQEDILHILIRQYPAMKDIILHAHCIGESSIGKEDIQGLNPWIWMSSPSLEKVSKHLVVGRICFSMWRTQMKLLVKELLALKKSYTSAIDEGILRKLGSLRLPLNHKRHKYGNPSMNGLPIVEKISPTLVFDDPTHKFTDGVILIHDANMYTMKNGIVLTPSDLAPEYQQQLVNVYGIYQAPSLVGDTDDSTHESDHELVSAFIRVDKLYHTGLKIGKLSGKYLPLIRKSPGTCPISGRKHDGDNAYIFKKEGRVFFACHRGCSIKIEERERKYIDITPWTGISCEDIARLAHEDVNKMNKSQDE